MEVPGGERGNVQTGGGDRVSTISLLRCSRVVTESGGTRRRTGGEVKGKEANGLGSEAGFILTRNSPSSVTTRKPVLD